MFRFTIRELMGLVVIAAVAALLGRIVLRADNPEELVATFGFFVYGAVCYVAGLLIARQPSMLPPV